MNIHEPGACARPVEIASVLSILENEQQLSTVYVLHKSGLRKETNSIGPVLLQMQDEGQV